MDLVYSTGNYIQYLVITYNGKELKIRIYIFFLFFLLFFLPHGLWSSWARDQIWAAVATHSHSWSNRSFNPLLQAKDQTYVWCCRDTAKPVVSQGLYIYIYHFAAYWELIQYYKLTIFQFLKVPCFSKENP